MVRRLSLAFVCCLSFPALAQFEPFPGDKPADPKVEPAPAAPVTTTPSAKFGLVFSLQNIFQNPGLLSGFNGGIGAQFALSERVSLRPTLSLSRTADNPVPTERTVVTNGMTTTTRTFSRPTGPTSTFGLGLNADVLYRLLEGALAPYVGGGLFVSYSSQARVFTDDTVMDQVTKVNDQASSFGFGVRGLLGVSWRVHPHFALFAEYALNISVINSQSATTSLESTVMGMASTIRSSSTSTQVFEFNTALNHGAALGVVASF